MLSTFEKNKRSGTVGCRLHFGNNLIQHSGIFGLINKEKRFGVSHISLNSYYNYSIMPKITLGNTGALLMIRKKLFELCGGFNEKYISCFEDVELNLRCILLGYVNITDNQSVAYHYESLTRNLDSKKLEYLTQDYIDNLIPFINKGKVFFWAY